MLTAELCSWVVLHLEGDVGTTEVDLYHALFPPVGHLAAHPPHLVLQVGGVADLGVVGIALEQLREGLVVEVKGEEGT